MRTFHSSLRSVLVIGVMAGGTLLPGAAASVAAQTGAEDANESHWGVKAHASPNWTIPDRLLDVDLLADVRGRDSKVRGSEFVVGLVRGRRLGGDWGLSYFRKTVSKSTRVELVGGRTCVAESACVRDSDVPTTNGLALHGVELHTFVPWFTVRRRAQVGMNLAIGAARLSADRATTVFHARGFLDDLGLPAVLPVAKLELAVAGIVSRRFKVRVSGGLNLPGMQSFSLTGIYFFGR